MKSSRDQFAFDDRCFIDSSLFHQLPIELAPGVFLASTPQHTLAQAAGKGSTERENIALAEWVYPGFGLGMGIVNACEISIVGVHLCFNEIG
ncbi:hypothetical protein [Parachlamydia acanthamoebae]|uniref:hypothetical protein n=1 Tax=Parachlamydia acanthamoebae TaxID=83552 RepID=UPI000750C68F|nr:hypothetical protein [Parachlamydia acanthamoebae]